MASEASGSAEGERPLHVKLVRGSWYWDLPDLLRNSHNLKTKALGKDQSAAWALARTLNRDHLKLGLGDPIIGSIAWLLEAFVADKAEPFCNLKLATQRDYRWIALRVLPLLPVSDIKKFGEFPAKGIRPRHADAVYVRLKELHGASAAHYACRVARRIWPWSGMQLKGTPAREQRWTETSAKL